MVEISFQTDTKINVTVARNLEEVEKLRPYWQELICSPEVDIDYYIAVLRNRKEIHRPHVIYLSESGIPKTILVGRLETLQLRSKLGYKVLYRPNIITIAILYNGLLGKRSKEINKKLMNSLTDSLMKNECKAIFFSHLCTESDFFDVARQKFHKIWLDPGIGAELHWQFELPKSVELLYQTRSSRTRSNIRRKGRRLEKHFNGNIEIKKCVSIHELPYAMEVIEDIAKNTYQRNINVGFRNNNEWNDIFKAMASKNCLYIYILIASNKPIAFLFGYITNGTFYYGIPGYDPKYRKLYAGSYLFMKVLEDLCCDPEVRVFDYGFGDADYKKAFSTNNCLEQHLYIFRPSTKSFVIRSIRFALRKSSFIIRFAITKIHLYSYFRRLFRQRV